MQRITANFETLLEQSPTAVNSYMDEGKDRIDTSFGKGYAKKNPALLAAFMLASAIDCASVTIAQQITDAIDKLGMDK